MPLFTVPVRVTQYVEVPFVARICPGVPVASVESRSSPVRRSLAIVEDERAAFWAKRLVDEELVEKKLVEVLLVIVPLVAPKLVLVPLVKNPLVAKELVLVALVIIEEVANTF